MSTRGRRNRVALSLSALLAGALALGAAPPAAAAGAVADASTEVNAFSGAFQTRVPIGVPAFRGIEPKLALQYSSAGSNGPIGVGWSFVGVSVIERASVARGVARYDGSDIFLLDGNDLIPGCGTYGGTHCTRVESYQKITWDGANNRWFVWAKDGSRSTYTALLNTTKGTHRWALSEVRDTKNNVVAYNSFCSGGDCYLDNVSYNGVVVKLYWEGRGDSVTYAIGGQGDCYNTCYQTCYASTCCDGYYDKYGVCQPTCDKYGTCTAGSYPCNPYDCNPYTCNQYGCGAGGVATTASRLKTIDVLIGGNRARAYRLSYVPVTTTGRSVLASIQQFGTTAGVDGAGNVSGAALPAMSFSAQGGGAGFGATVWGTGTSQHMWNGGGTLASYQTLTGDFNGDGKTDFVTVSRALAADSAWRYMFAVELATGSGFSSQTWAATTAQHMYNGGGTINDYQFVVADVNGDGKSDIVTARRPDSVGGGWYGWFAVELSTGSGFTSTTWSATTSQHMYNGGGTTSDYRIMAADVNGDGKDDVVTVSRALDPSSGWRYWYAIELSTGSGFTSTAWNTLGSQRMYDGGGTINDYRVMVADVNGDGKSDVVIASRGLTANSAWRYGYSVEVSTGSGFISQMWAATSAQHIYNGEGTITDYRIMVGDFNGDGKSDIVTIRKAHTTGTGWYYWFALELSTGTAFASTAWNATTAQHMYNEGGVTGDFQIQVADVNGDGKSDIVTARKAGGTGSGWYYWFAVELSLGNGFSSTAWSTSTPQHMFNGGGATTDYHLLVGDVNGDGKSDLVTVSRAQSADSGWRYWFAVDVTTAQAPDLLTTLANGLGGTTTVNYTPSSTWSNTYLPVGVVMQTVASVVSTDGRGDSQTTTYSYQGAKWRNATAADPTREFLGFRKATTTLGATGAYSETYYWQRAGTIAKPEVVYKRKANGAIMSFDKLYFTENAAPPYTSLATQAWSYECNGNGVVDANHNYVSGCRRVVATYEWDPYANMTREYQYGDYDVGGDERTVARTFVPNLSTYIVGLPQYEYMYAGIGTGGAVLTMTNFYYDDAGPTWAWMVPPTEGKLTRKATWLDTTGTWPSSTFGYDAWGNETSVTDSLGRTATKTYDGTYHLLTTSSTNELGHVVQSGWDGLGRLTRSTDPDLNATTHTYDAFGRGLLTTKPDGSQVKVEHLYYGDINNQRIRSSALLPGGQWVYDDSYFDGVGRPYRTVSSTGVTSDTIYGPTGKPWKKSLPYVAGETVRYDVSTYDDLGREIAVQLPDGSTLTKTYYNGAVSATDAVGNTRTAWVDGYSRLTATREVIGGVNRDTTFYYDLLGRRTKSVDALGVQTVASYDSLGRVVQKSDPDQGLWQYRYDDLGRITKETDALGRATVLGYDLLGRITRRTYHNGTYDSYTFDEAGRGSAKGRLTTSVSASGVTTRAFYDNLGRRTRYEEVIDGATYVLSHTYDLAGRMATATYPDGEVVTYGYGTSGTATGKLVSVSGSAAGTLVSAIGYSTKGQVSSVTYGNGVTTTTGFDPMGERVTSIQIGSLAAITYGYDGNGRIVSMASPQLGLTNWTYGYDSIGRLTRATNTADGTKSETFTYDAGGRMLSKSSLGSYTYGDAAHVHAVTAAGANTYSYDATGNMVAGAGRTFTYDQDHRPLSITYGGSTTSFVYDAQGVRVKKTGASGTVVYVGGVQEKRGTAVTKYYFAGALRVAKRDANGNQYFHADHLGSTRLVTNQSGAEVKRYEYAAYGAVIGQSGSLPDSHRYAGHEADDETGLVFFQARYYDPALGRFVQPDSFVPNANSPQELDLYAYSGNSPINYVDPSGHAPALVAVGLMSAATAATVTAIGLTVGTLVNIAAVVIGTALTFSNNPILQTIGMVMSGMGGAALFGGPSLFGNAAWGATATGGLVALAQSPISPLDPTVKKVIGWAYTIAGAVKNIGEVAWGEKPWTPFGLGKDSSWAYTRSVCGPPSAWDWVKATLAVGASDILKTAGGWVAAYVLSGSEIGRYVSAFASRFVMAAMQGTAGPLAVIGATYDLAYTLKYPDGRVYDLSNGDPNGEAFIFYYHTGFESPGYALGRQHIRVAGRGGYWELGDTRAGFFGPGLGWGGWIGTQKITVILSPAQARAFVGAMEAAAAAGGRYQGYHADSHTYVSAALQLATGKTAADLHINPGLIHW